MENRVTVIARATNPTACCPSCGYLSTSIHSYYLRSPHDLPSSGRSVQLKLQVRRFRCQQEACPRQTFAERLPQMVAASAQRTVRLTKLLHAFSIALSGEAASCLLADVGVPASADTLLRLVKRSQLPSVETPKAIGVDDFALRRGQTYGTIVVDLSAALRAALTFAYSNGPVEGHVNKLKLIKRSMYGRGSFELLRQRVLQAP